MEEADFVADAIEGNVFLRSLATFGPFHIEGFQIASILAIWLSFFFGLTIRIDAARSSETYNDQRLRRRIMGIRMPC
jgi:hypothetical protein